MWEFLLWCCRRRRRWEVQGRSMLPTLNPGDQVLIHLEAYQLTTPQAGEIVLARHPFQHQLYLIKRIQSVNNNSYFLIGDNAAESTDSRVFHAVSLDCIVGKVTSFF
ncbi:nickel-type superoxide dismutase maturation protease [Acaryochloris marina NIES-2412]|uniref:nickel-type superoxide dismutase maturation protease n=1 Tax=Acaryochloris marina TaxID=155978 RepID=UPI004057F8FD